MNRSSRRDRAADERTRTQTGSSGAVLEEEPLVPVLTVIHHAEPEHIGERLPLAHATPIVLGRGSDLFEEGTFDDSRLSRQHVELARRGDELELRDLGSRNGTWVNGQRVGAARLSEGDALALGKIVLLLHRAPFRPKRSRSAGELVGVGHLHARLLAQIATAAPLEATVLLQGESGSGKELVARALHEQSGRKGAFVAINCGSLSDGVLQAELFGHRRGAFSGAGEARAGLIAAAKDGTLLLDEIGDASPALQASLLRLLQERTFRPVGADQEIRTDARFVAATHVPLAAAVADGRFRADLFARLNRLVIELPPLCARKEDIIPIALAVAARATGAAARLSQRLALALVRHDWPLNVRELEAVVEQAAAEAQGAELDLSPAIAARLVAPPHHEPGSPRTRARPSPEELEALFHHVGGNLCALARELGVGRTTLYRWLEHHEVDLNAWRARAP